MSPELSGTAGNLFRHPPFLFFFTARGFSKFCYQIGAVAVGWQVYELTNSALDLGLVGLAQFIPMAMLVFVAGHAADQIRSQTRGSDFAAHSRGRGRFSGLGQLCRLAERD